jgi:hypothetical protein
MKGQAKKSFQLIPDSSVALESALTAGCSFFRESAETSSAFATEKEKNRASKKIATGFIDF